MGALLFRLEVAGAIRLYWWPFWDSKDTRRGLSVSSVSRMLRSEPEGVCFADGPVGRVVIPGATVLIDASAFLVAVAEVPSRTQISLVGFLLVRILLDCPIFGAIKGLESSPRTKGPTGPAGEV